MHAPRLPHAGGDDVAVQPLGAPRQPDPRAARAQEERGITRAGEAPPKDVAVALCFRCSTSQVEGQVQRLKVMKRSMYGRANFDLLRKRVLHAA